MTTVQCSLTGLKTAIVFARCKLVLSEDLFLKISTSTLLSFDVFFLTCFDKYERIVKFRQNYHCVRLRCKSEPTHPRIGNSHCTKLFQMRICRKAAVCICIVLIRVRTILKVGISTFKEIIFIRKKKSN